MATLCQVQKSNESVDGGAAAGKEMPISALITPSNPMGRKYKECIADGGSCQEETTVDNQSVQEDEEIRMMQAKFDMKEFRAKLRVAEALAQASSMTSPAAKRRLEARKIEMDMTKDQEKPVFLNDENEEYTPPKELLIYIMR